MRQDERQALRKIKLWAKINAFSYSQHAFEIMVSECVYEEDVKRALTTARLLETRDNGARGTAYILAGFGMNENTLVLICRLLRQKVMVEDFYWD